ncbi:MAG: hypothetical protein SF162_10295 [bacterium]|nr:hypothetical protein [bacterium]
MSTRPPHGETQYHQAAKLTILGACRAAGWQADPEVIGGDWRADVLAVRGETRIAFEVQWSFLKLDEALARQDRYARDGVRGCWFFRTPPAWMIHEPDDPAVRRTLKAWKRLPLFHLYPNLSGTFSVDLNGTVHPLEAFVTRLIGGGVHYCTHAAAPPGTQVQAAIRWYDVRCPACGAISRVHGASAWGTSACGAAFPVDEARLVFDAAVLAALRLPSHMTAFACRACESPFDAETLAAARYGVRREAALMVAVTLREPLRAPVPHWCAAPQGSWCC